MQATDKELVKLYKANCDELIEDVRVLNEKLDRIEAFVDFKILSNPSSGQYIGIKHYIDKVRRGRDEY